MLAGNMAAMNESNGAVHHEIKDLSPALSVSRTWQERRDCVWAKRVEMLTISNELRLGHHNNRHCYR